MFRKIRAEVRAHLKKNPHEVLVLDGARQVGKSYIIREVGTELFKNYIEINLLEDAEHDRLFEHARTVDDFYLQLSMVAGDRMGARKDTLVFLDEIQAYPHLLTLIKFLRQDDRFTYVASGSLLGVTLAQTSSIPMGSIAVRHLFPMDFEEFLLANKFAPMAIDAMRKKCAAREPLEENQHAKVMDLFKKYLLVGGLPAAVRTFVEQKNIVAVRAIQTEIHRYYGMDAAKYDREKKLKIQRIYEMIPSNLENKKKRVVVQDIEGKKGRRFSDYQDEFDYLVNAGIVLEVRAISAPTFPLMENAGKNLLKLYLNDVGILTGLLYRNNIRAVMGDERSVNLGTLYESVVAQELRAHGFSLFYYDNRARGEVDFLIDDYDSLSVVPIEVKSGKDYTRHSALRHFVATPDYTVKKAYVFSNERRVFSDGAVTYLPVYYAMFLTPDNA